MNSFYARKVSHESTSSNVALIYEVESFAAKYKEQPDVRYNLDFLFIHFQSNI